MATIEQIQEFLGFEIPEGKTLREGKHKPKKNQYYYPYQLQFLHIVHICITYKKTDLQ